jgi:hypothetical protein
VKLFVKILYKIEIVEPFIPEEDRYHFQNLIKLGSQTRLFWESAHNIEMKIENRIENLQKIIKFYTDWRNLFIYLSKDKMKQQKIIKICAIKHCISLTTINMVQSLLDYLIEIKRLGININIRAIDTCPLESFFNLIRRECYNPNEIEFDNAFKKCFYKKDIKWGNNL